MSDVIDLNAARNERAKPDPELSRRDDYGREMFTYLLSYEMGEKQWCTEVWAYDETDAAARVSAMRATLTMDGKLHSRTPA